ncbi:MAG: 3-keto-5-aminohexanoate cleavage protein, partial [Dehalococcoidia bacterium]|nr:3-keto-5-aminohexanoate cleavage protein [Dehalococcoidia bacterium]
MTDEKILRKVIITAAITGQGPTPSMSDYLPITPEQIADDALKAYEAGAAIAHVHARKPETGEPTADLRIFREILTDIKSRCNMIICVTTGGAGTPAERIAVVPEFRPELATLNCGSLSGTMIQVWERLKPKGFKYDWEGARLQREDLFFQNTYKMMHEFGQIERENDTKPEVEIWDTGQIYAAKFMLD